LTLEHIEQCYIVSFSKETAQINTILDTMAPKKNSGQDIAKRNKFILSHVTETRIQ